MRRVEEILEMARVLSAGERRELLAKLEAAAAEESEPSPSEHPYGRTVAAAGIGRADVSDVSADKYKYLAEAYGEIHDEK